MQPIKERGHIGHYNHQRGYGRLVLDIGHVVDFHLGLYDSGKPKRRPVKGQLIEATFATKECYDLLMVRRLPD